MSSKNLALTFGILHYLSMAAFGGEPTEKQLDVASTVVADYVTYCESIDRYAVSAIGKRADAATENPAWEEVFVLAAEDSEAKKRRFDEITWGATLDGRVKMVAVSAFYDKNTLTAVRNGVPEKFDLAAKRKEGEEEKFMGPTALFLPFNIQMGIPVFRSERLEPEAAFYMRLPTCKVRDFVETPGHYEIQFEWSPQYDMDLRIRFDRRKDNLPIRAEMYSNKRKEFVSATDTQWDRIGDQWIPSRFLIKLKGMPGKITRETVLDLKWVLGDKFPAGVFEPNQDEYSPTELAETIEKFALNAGRKPK